MSKQDNKNGQVKKAMRVGAFTFTNWDCIQPKDDIENKKNKGGGEIEKCRKRVRD